MYYLVTDHKLFIFLEDTIALADDTVAGAFGPTARSIKIKNLRKYPYKYSLQLAIVSNRG